MIFSSATKAAIKAVVYIGSEMPTRYYVPIADIISVINENEHTLRKVLQLLVKHQILQSSQGKFGGFTITEVQLQLPVYEIVKLVDGPDNFQSCILGLDACSESKPCPLHDDYKNAQKSGLAKPQEKHPKGFDSGYQSRPSFFK